jgi:hypothetical protein
MKDAHEEVRALDDDAIARAVDADGGDAKAIAARGAKLAADLIARRKRLMWQVDARGRIAKARARVAAMPATPRPTRAEMEARIEEARKDATFAPALAARKGGTEKATDDDLADLLEQIEILRILRDENP